MFLPPYVTTCIDALEGAGFAAYAVGGCVRDSLLGLQPQDFDLCTNALPEQTERVFQDYRLILAGKKHGTVAVILGKNVVEITTFRTEGGYQDNRHPDWVKFVPDIEEDLSRRDFTVNAMAYSPTRGYADPFGGQEDLRSGILRAVGNPRMRFQEDALRILRGIRFAARYGFALDEETEKAMAELAPLMDSLARERVFDELSKLLPRLDAVQLNRFAPILAQVIPELKPMIGFDQRSPPHAYDLMTHVGKVVEKMPGDPALRWAALLHDVGKVPTFTQDATGRGHFYGHAQVSAQMAEAILQNLKAPNALRQEVVTLIGQHMTKQDADKRLLRRRLNKLGWDTLNKLLILQEADMASKGTPCDLGIFSRIRSTLEELKEENACVTLKDLAVNGRDLMALGITGKALGQTLQFLLEQVMDEALPNEKQALLQKAMEVAP